MRAGEKLLFSTSFRETLIADSKSTAKRSSILLELLSFPPLDFSQNCGETNRNGISSETHSGHRLWGG
ncbi:hypothetical protein NPIL_141881 [Nephila pilipes]|uniref:Uncharacterized protein n=1 Tax=Nephila pilipes TaxID=299642 RepID=A0A8X6IGH0_NEPPI|nr:hypothetical protein NPIL_141881 [Nephila pilipes]